MSVQALEFVNTQGGRHFVGLSSISIVLEVTEDLAEKCRERGEVAHGKTWIFVSGTRIELEESYESVVQRISDHLAISERETRELAEQQMLAFARTLRGVDA